MPRRPSPDTPAEGSFPSKADVLAFVADAKGKVGKREIARAFGLGAGDKQALKALIRELEGEGLVERHRRGLAHAGQLPTVVVADITLRDGDGDLIATPTEWDEEERGRAPKILVRLPRRGKDAMPAPGVGDRLLLRVERSRDEGPAYTGRVLKRLSSRARTTIGVYRALPGGGGRMMPVDKKAQGREIAIADSDRGDARDGDLVAVEAGSDFRLGLKQGRVREVLGSLASERAISLIAIHAHAIPHVFSPEALREAEAAGPVAVNATREDWRALPLVTIDPADAKDHDDAVHAVADDDPDNRGGFVLTIAIADVAAYVRPGSALDQDALDRGNSVYFPDRVVPMLPERISNDLCSLKPGVDRPALAFRVVIAADGRKLRHSLHRIMMRSVAKLAYPQAQAAIDGHPDDTTAPLLDTVLKPLWAAYGALKIARDRREPLNLDLPERKLKLDEKGHVATVLTPERLDAHRLIEEMMILANVCAAETLEEKGAILVYRVHDEPSLEKMQSLREFLESLEIGLPKAGALRPALFNRILARVSGTQHVHLVNEVVLRSQAQAEYAPENYGHFGLNLRRYAHFTSPIRRYADLIVHRALIRALRLGDDGLPDTTLDIMREIAARISAAERRAMVAERETVDRLIATHLVEHVGASFTARIGGVTRSGLFVRLVDMGADGFIPAATLGADYYAHDEALHALVGQRTGETYRLGDQVEVRLLEALPFAGALRFEMLSEGSYMKVKDGGSRTPRRTARSPDALRSARGKAASLKRRRYGK
jgi:ribonuclease R